MASHLYIEIQLICLVFFVILLLRIVKANDQRTSLLYFRWLLFWCILTFFFDAMQAVMLDFNPAGHIGVIYFINIAYYITLGLSGWLWFLYSESEQNSLVTANRRWVWLSSMGAVLIGVLAITAPFNHALFYITEQGTYARGDWHFLQLIISYGYIASTSIKAFWLAHKSANFEEKSHLRTTGSLIVPVAITGACQIVLPNLPILCAGCADSLLFCYLIMQEENIFTDPLTKVNNRRRLMRNLETLINRAREEHASFGVLMIDADKFKQINDTYGHVEGDNALIHIANALMNVTGPGLHLYRYGGDEFILTSDDGSKEYLTSVVETIQSAIAAESALLVQNGSPYELRVSVGYATFDFADASPNDIVKRADENLYAHKHKGQ